MVEETEKITARVYEKIFLDLQQDEIEFANKEFRDLYNILMTEYQINGFVSIEILFTLGLSLAFIVVRFKYLVHNF